MGKLRQLKPIEPNEWYVKKDKNTRKNVQFSEARTSKYVKPRRARNHLISYKRRNRKWWNYRKINSWGSLSSWNGWIKRRWYGLANEHKPGRCWHKNFRTAWKEPMACSSFDAPSFNDRL